jgi:hypothetical protein
MGAKVAQCRTVSRTIVLGVLCYFVLYTILHVATVGGVFSTDPAARLLPTTGLDTTGMGSASYTTSGSAAATGAVAVGEESVRAWHWLDTAGAPETDTTVAERGWGALLGLMQEVSQRTQQVTDCLRHTLARLARQLLCSSTHKLCRHNACSCPAHTCHPITHVLLCT